MRPNSSGETKTAVSSSNRNLTRKSPSPTKCVKLKSSSSNKETKDKVNNNGGSAALEVVANKWKSIYSAEICCFQIFHRFATKYLKAYTMLRWIALKFVAAPRKGTVLDPGFSIGNLIRDRSVFIPKHKRNLNNAEFYCFYIFHRFALKYAKGHTMLR